MSYELGLYHPVVYEASGIKEFKDIKGKKVFLGPPAGIATRNTTLIIEAMTGYRPGKDFQQVKMDWGPAQQAFQDRKFDVWITVTTPLGSQVREIHAGNNYVSQNPAEAHFGLASATTADVEVRWPDGGVTSLSAVAVDQLLTVSE